MPHAELSETIRNYAIVIGGFVGLVLAAWRVRAANRQSDAAARQADIARRAHLSEVFKDAVALLSSENLEIRLGAILTLGRIAGDFDDAKSMVVELLEAYIRERTANVQGDSVTADIEAIMVFLRAARGLDVHD